MKTTTLEFDGIKERVDVFVSRKLGCSRSHVKRACDGDNVFVGGIAVKSNKVLKKGDTVVIKEDEPKNLDVTPRDIPIKIVYQDEDLAVIDKPQGMTVHAGNGTSGDTLVNALLFHLDKLSGINGVVRPGIVHRIDKNTSGLLVVAKNDAAHVSLSKQIEKKTCKRNYIALLEGNLKTDSGVIDTEIGRDRNNRTKMAVVSVGRRAVTLYKVLKRFEGYTLCEFSLKTGRTHQIRVHAKYLGHPIVGDREYGYKNCKFKLNGQLLHAYKLTFNHPTDGREMTFTSPLPDYFEKTIDKLKEI